MRAKKVIPLAEAKASCSSCGAFVMYQGQKDMGECRLNPPTAYAVDGVLMSSPPPVPPTHWCLQFKAMN